MKKKLLLFGIILSFGGAILAQQGNTMYFMDQVPHANHLNPAKQHPCNAYLGIPGINNIYFSVGNNALAYDKLFVYNNLTDSVNLSLNTPENRSDILMSSFHPINYIDAAFRMNYLSVGTRSDNDYFITFDYATRMDMIMSYPKDFASFLGEQEIAADSSLQDWSNLGFKANVFNEFALGVSKEVNDDFSYGLKAKILFGIAHASMKTEKFYKYTSMSNWNFDVDANVKIAAPEYINLDSVISHTRANLNGSDTTGHQYVDDGEDITDDLIGAAFALNNLGLALDLGVIYKPLDELELSASVLDVGFIRWSANTYTAKSKQTFSLEGDEVDYLRYVFGDTINMLSFVNELNDSTVDKILGNFEEDDDPFYTMLTGKVYLGARYYVHDNIALGVLSSTRIYNSKLRESLALSANFYPVKWFSGSISYNMAYHSYNSMGIGLCFKPGPVNLYMIADKVPLFWTSDYAPYYAKFMNFRLGLNLIFGCGKKVKDVPMID